MPPPSPHNVSDVTLPIITAIEPNVVCPGFSPPTRLCCLREEGIHPSLCPELYLEQLPMSQQPQKGVRSPSPGGIKDPKEGFLCWRDLHPLFPPSTPLFSLLTSITPCPFTLYPFTETPPRSGPPWLWEPHMKKTQSLPSRNTSRHLVETQTFLLGLLGACPPPHVSPACQ